MNRSTWKKKLYSNSGAAKVHAKINCKGHILYNINFKQEEVTLQLCFCMYRYTYTVLPHGIDMSLPHQYILWIWCFITFQLHEMMHRPAVTLSAIDRWFWLPLGTTRQFCAKAYSRPLSLPKLRHAQRVTLRVSISLWLAQVSLQGAL